MDETKIYKCDNCGAEYTEWKSFCRKCSASMPKREIVLDEKLEGYDKTEVLNFIDNNSNRYYKIFKDNEGNFKFNHMNWAAFFWSYYWMFYRKMYKNGFITFILGIVIACLAFALSIVLVAAQLNTTTEKLGVYGEYVAMERSEIDSSLFEDGPLDVVQYEIAKATYDRQFSLCMAEIIVITGAVGIGYMIYIGLKADSIYKRHVFKHINNPQKGSTSGWALVLAIVMNGVLSRFLTRVVLLILGAIFISVAA